MTDIKHFTGAVNINGDVTPISREPIGQVTPEKWKEMTIENLWEQRFILSERMAKAHQSGYAGLAQQVQTGITSLDVFIQKRSVEIELDATNSGLIR